jgi:hypothetical protein
MDVNKEWVPVRWILSGTEMDLINFHIDSVPHQTGIRFAVRRLSYCLNNDLEWEYEPINSDRDEDFFKRCRLGTFEEAQQRVRDWHAKKVG